MFLSTPPSRVATPAGKPVLVPESDVSIHATLAGGDYVPNAAEVEALAFLSTPPSRVATVLHERLRRTHKCFYPRHPRGWRPSNRARYVHLIRVSIHATLAGGDAAKSANAAQRKSFLSTPPSRVATGKPPSASTVNIVSIHATLAGGDGKSVQKCTVSFAQKGKIICKIKNNLKHPPHIPIATSKKCTACPKMSDGIGAKLLGKVCLLSPRTGAATQAAHHPEQIRGGGQGAPRGFCSGCQAGKSAGCRFRGQSARPARL